MNENESIMHRFYSAFQVLDYKAMKECYDEDIIFSDPAFGLLRGNEVNAMWEMLCKRAKDFKLEFSNVHSDNGDEYGTTNWTAYYTFSKTGRRVRNDVKAYMRFGNGKIIEHSDAFSLHKWSRQALGFSGWLFGWSGFFQRAIQKRSRMMLEQFMVNN